MGIIYTMFIFNINLIMIEIILNEVDKRHASSGGHCGISPVELCRILGKKYSEIKEHLNQLHSENRIKVRMGINSLLLFKS